MVHGKKGLQLEAMKFSIYIVVPIVASVAFNQPEVQEVCADYFQMMKYPANPNTNLKKEFEELQKQRLKEKEQREAYMDQMQKLQERAQKNRIEEAISSDNNSDVSNRRGWFGWLKRS